MTARVQDINFKEYTKLRDRMHDKQDAVNFVDQASQGGDLTKELLESMITRLKNPHYIDADFKDIEPRVIEQIYDETVLGTRHPTDALGYYNRYQPLRPTTGCVVINRPAETHQYRVIPLPPDERVKEMLIYMQGVKKHQNIVKRDGGYLLPGYLHESGLNTWVEYEWPAED